LLVSIRSHHGHAADHIAGHIDAEHDETIWTDMAINQLYLLYKMELIDINKHAVECVDARTSKQQVAGSSPAGVANLDLSDPDARILPADPATT
jgi:hypothetical protein